MLKQLATELKTPFANLWLSDMEAIHDETLLFPFLDEKELTRFVSFMRKERRSQFLMGRFLLKSSLADMLGIAPCEITISTAMEHIPQLKLPGHIQDIPGFSLSHSGKWIACAISPQMNLGLDIEVMEKKRNLHSIAEKVFLPHEYEKLIFSCAKEQKKTFYTIWTKKEALYKLMSYQKKQLPSFHSMDSISFIENDEVFCYNRFVEESDLMITLCGR